MRNPALSRACAVTVMAPERSPAMELSGSTLWPELPRSILWPLSVMVTYQWYEPGTNPDYQPLGIQVLGLETLRGDLPVFGEKPVQRTVLLNDAPGWVKVIVHQECPPWAREFVWPVYKVTTEPWEKGLVIGIEGFGPAVTQTHRDCPQDTVDSMARDYIAVTLDVSSRSFDIEVQS